MATSARGTPLRVRRSRRARVATALSCVAVFVALTTSPARAGDDAVDPAIADSPAARSPAKWVDARLQRRIDAAIDRGVAYLTQTQNRFGGWYTKPEPILSSLGISYAALCGVALRHGGVSRDDERVTRARERVLDEIRRRWHKRRDLPVIDTYAAGLSTAFLLDAGVERTEPTLTGVVRMLADGYSTDGLWHYLRVWMVPGSRGRFARDARQRGGNISTTQYALEGLLAAHRRGMQVDTRGVALLRQTLRSMQAPGGGFHYQANFTEARVRRVRKELSLPYFGATASALASYLMAGEILGDSDSPEVAARDTLVVRGTQWLASHFDKSAGWRISGRDAQTSSTTYNLYAAERVGVLLATDRFDDLRWYERGARDLLKHQFENGSWPESAQSTGWDPRLRTAYAILFLSRAGHPIGGPTTPSGRRAVTGSASDGFPLEQAAELERKDWFDLYHASMQHLEFLSDKSRGAFAKRLAGFGPRVVRVLVRDLESERVDRRSAANDALTQITGEDIAFDPAAKPLVRRRALKFWKRWLAALEPQLRLVSGRLVIGRVVADDD